MARIAEAFVEIKARTDQLQRGLNRSVSQTQTAMGRIRGSVSRIVGPGGVFGLAAIAALGLAKAIRGIAQATAEQVRAEIRLNAVLQAFGDRTDRVTSKLLAQASALQQLTAIGDEEIILLFARIRALGVEESAIRTAAEATLGLASAFGLSNEQVARYVALAFQGEFTMLRRYIPALRRTTDAQEQLSIVLEEGNKGFQALQNQAGAIPGQIQKIRNSFTDLKQAIGDIFLSGPLGIALTQGLNQALRNIQGFFDALVRIVERNTLTIQNIILELGRAIGAAIRAGLGFPGAGLEVFEAIERIRDLLRDLAVGTAGAIAVPGGGPPGTSPQIDAAARAFVSTIQTATGPFRVGQQGGVQTLINKQQQTTDAIDEMRTANRQNTRALIQAIRDISFANDAFTP